MALAGWHLYVCGINHRTATVDQRGPLQLLRGDYAQAGGILCGLPGVMESAVVSTCNRIEFYFVADKSEDPFSIVSALYQRARGLDIHDLHDLFYIKKDRHAVDHLFRVAAGIDSMVLGENQIVGQLKESYSAACSVRAAGKIMHRLFHQAFRAGKQVRSDTQIGQGACSVSGVAMEIVTSRIGGLEHPTILFVGINNVIALSASILNSRDSGRFLFANRTREKAVAFARQYDAQAFSLEELPSALPLADVVITSTGATHPILTRALFQELLRDDPHKRLLIMDLAVPRDVEIEKDFSAQVEVYDLEDIKSFLEKRGEAQQKVVFQAEELIERRLAEFMYWFDQVRHEPLYNGLDRQFELLRQEELSKVLAKLPAELQCEVDHATTRLVNRLLQLKIRTSSDPTKSVRPV